MAARRTAVVIGVNAFERLDPADDPEAEIARAVRGLDAPAHMVMAAFGFVWQPTWVRVRDQRRVSELAAGRPTVFGVPSCVEPGDEVRRYGPTLLTVLHEYQVDIHRRMADKLALPSNRGFGSVRDEEVAAAWEQVEQVEALQRRLS